MPASRTAGHVEFLLVAGGALAILALIALNTDPLTFDHPRFARDDDHHKYIYLATHNPFSLHIAPFGWRPLAPSIARLLPVDLQVGFYSITFISLWLTAVAVYFLARVLGFSQPLATIGMLMFLSMGWATKFNLYDFWLTDPLAFLFITTATIFIITGRDVTLAFLLAVGVLAKESVFFVVPLYYGFHARRLLDGPAALRTIAVAVPCVAVLAALRIAVPAMNTDPSYTSTLPDRLYSPGDAITYDFLARPVEVIEYRIRDLSPGAIYAATVAPGGLAVTLLVFAGGRRGLRRAGRFLPFLALCYAQLLYAPVNTERLLVVAFPALIVLALTGVDAIMDRFKASPGPFLILFSILVMALVVVPSFAPPLRYQLLIVAVMAPFLFGLGARATPTRWWPAASKTRRKPPD
jgi:hypothetical protein